MSNDAAGTAAPAKGLSAAQAQEIAVRTVATLPARHAYVLEPAKTQELDFGWVFFYTPAEYLRTQDRRFLTPGNGPLVVYRADGKTEFLTTSMPPAQAIKVLAQRLAAPQP